MNPDWRDGFLFVGNHLSLDFLNTRPVMDGNPVELLPECTSLARWLKAADLVPAREAKRLERSWSAQPAFTGMLVELREFRESLRQAVLQMEGGARPSPTLIGKVNELLSAHPHIDQLIQTDSGLVAENGSIPNTSGRLRAHTR